MILGIFGLLFVISCKKEDAPYAGFTMCFERSQPINDSELSKIPSKFRGVFMNSDSVYFNVTEKMKVPMEAVSNGIDLVRFQPGKPPKSFYESFNLPTDAPIITYVGRLDAEKHLPYLIKAFAQVLETKNAHLLIIGSGQDALSLKQLAYELKVMDKVTFTGRVSEEDKQLLHQVGSVFAMPSPMELQSIATLEAMASGLPVVAVNAGALGELCQNERNGFLCEQDNADQIADGILKIISDPKLHAQMSKESLAIANTHDLNTTLARFEAIYESLIKA